MNMEVAFKVYAKLASGSKPEVRRFCVDRSVVTSFTYLAAKLEEVFPALKGRKYTIAYKDDEGDDITVSSDEEIILALQSMTGDVVRLHVEREDSAPAGGRDADIEVDMSFLMPPGAGDGVATQQDGAGCSGGGSVHPGVVCDGCEGAVVGFRYRCTSCRDYDLCQACEADGKHSQHCMLRIPSPMPRFHIKSKIKRSRHMKATTCAEEVSEERRAEGAECPYFKKQRRDKSGERRHHAGGRRARGSWLDTVASYMNEFANLAGDVAAPAGATAFASASASAAAPQPPAGVSEPAPQAEAGPVPTNTPNETGEVPIVPQIQLDKLLNPENMKYVLEIQKTLASILLPGLAGEGGTGDDDAAGSRQQACAGSQTERPAAAQASSQTAARASSHAGTQASSPAGTQDGSHAGTRASQPAGERQSPERAGDGWTLINNDTDLMDVGAAPSAPEPPAHPIGFKDLPHSFAHRLQINDGSGLYPNIADAAAGGAAIPLPAPQPAAPAPQPAVPAPPAPQPAAPAPKPSPQPAMAPTQAPRVLHPKPHIEAAINQMLNMGFTNEGGWLTQLLESKDGNISSVLDLLTPVTVKRP